MCFYADIFANAVLSNTSRTGVYFVSLKLLEQFGADDQFRVELLFTENITQDVLHKINNNVLLNKYPFVFSNRILNFNGGVKIKNPKLDLSKYDLCFSTYGGEMSSTLFNTNQFGVLHDTIPLLMSKGISYDLNDRNNFYTLHKKNLNKNTTYFCVSESCRSDFIHYFPDNLDPNKMHVVHLAPTLTNIQLNKKDNVKNIINKYCLDINSLKKYILSLCTVETRKNIIFTLRSFVKFIKTYHIEDLHFLVAGCESGNRDEADRLENEIKSISNDTHGKVIRMGYIDDNDLSTLFRNSLAFTYISNYEGFGIPPLDAMVCGTPVIASATSSLPEVLDNAAIMIQPDDEEMCIKSFYDLYFYNEYRNKIVEYGKKYVQKYSWQKTASKIKIKMIERFHSNERNYMVDNILNFV
jgi:glycosyltransferase involved in cell wall biosynthesis